MSIAKTKAYRATRALDVVENPQDWTYKVPGFLTWLIVGMTIGGLIWFPRPTLITARVMAFYMLARFIVVVTFYWVGLRKMRDWQAGVAQNGTNVTAQADPDLLRAVQHVVLVPNYREPVEVLARTLEGLAVQEDARQRITVVLAMEDSEAGGRAKAQALKERFEERFARMLVTFHPARLPGETPGKGANQAWAAHQARRELVDRLNIPLDTLTVTSCDADSVFHPNYFGELTRLFAADPQRHARFWQAPVFFDSNIWDVAVPVRLLTFFNNAVQLAELAGPFAQAMPLSTYSLSFKLADQAGYWDPAVIAEDWHMFLRCFFATRGQASVWPIFLPTRGDAVVGETIWRSLANFYRQQLRHAWGCQDVGYILQQWGRWPGTPFHKKLQRLVKVVHDHLIWTAGAVVIVVGVMLSLALEAAPVITLPPNFAYPVIAGVMNLFGVIGTGIIWLNERRRASHNADNWRFGIVLREAGTWVLLTVLTFLMLGVPVIHAQTKMLFGSPLAYFTTPKRISS